MSTKENWSDLNVVSYGGTKKGLKNVLSDELILDKKDSKFYSLIPSRGNTPTLPLVATYSNYAEYGDGFVRGAIYFDEQGEYHKVSLDGETYDFIDGFDHGLARVYKNVGGKKKWGIVGLIKTSNGYKAEILIPLKYDNIRNFYDKQMTSVTATNNDVTEDIPLGDLRKELKSMRKTIIAINEDTFKTFNDSYNHKESFRYDAQTMVDACDYIFMTKLSNLANGNKINLLVNIIANKSETFLMSDLGTFSEHINKHDFIGELIWGIEIDSEQIPSYRFEVIAGWNVEVEFSDDGMQVKVKGTDFEPVSSVTIEGNLYSVGHAKGKMYDFGVIDHTNKRVVLPFEFNHITIGMQTYPLIVSANYHGRWYVLKPDGDDFGVERIEQETIVDSHRYTLIDGFDHGLARVRIDDFWGIIDTDGTEVLPVEYQAVWNFYGKNRSYTKVEKNGKSAEIWFKDFAKTDSFVATDGSPLNRLPYMPKLRSIGMKNFMRFKDNTEIEFKDINFCVGPNNAGKSTSIKALLLLSSNLRKLRLDFRTIENNGITERGVSIPFDFALQEYPNLNTNSYFLSVNRQERGHRIKLSMSFGQCDFVAYINQDSNVEILSILSRRTDLKIIVHNNSAKLYSKDTLLKEYLIRDNKDIYPSLRGADLLNVIVDGFVKVVPLSDNCIEDNLAILKTDIQDAIQGIGNEAIIHIPIYSASRNAIFNRYDNNDLSAKAITTFFDLPFPQKGFARKFMLKWMDSDHFNIGSDFKIASMKDRNTLLTIEVKDVDGGWMDLCDLGTGSNHLFILLLSVACLIGEYATKTKRPIIAIEEPEMNLHPKYQSLLTDMIVDANECLQDLSRRILSNIFLISDKQINNLGFQFIIETHSEYMIRKTQLLVAKNEYEDVTTLLNHTPFEIVYYPQNGKPYDMGWNIYGRFVNFFDEGFFDVASSDAIAVSKIERSRK